VNLQRDIHVRQLRLQAYHQVQVQVQNDARERGQVKVQVYWYRDRYNNVIEHFSEGVMGGDLRARPEAVECLRDDRVVARRVVHCTANQLEEMLEEAAISER
jgi:hypothetical protein